MKKYKNILIIPPLLLLASCTQNQDNTTTNKTVQEKPLINLWRCLLAEEINFYNCYDTYSYLIQDTPVGKCMASNIEKRSDIMDSIAQKSMSKILLTDLIKLEDECIVYSDLKEKWEDLSSATEITTNEDWNPVFNNFTSSWLWAFIGWYLIANLMNNNYKWRLPDTNHSLYKRDIDINNRLYTWNWNLSAKESLKAVEKNREETSWWWNGSPTTAVPWKNLSNQNNSNQNSSNQNSSLGSSWVKWSGISATSINTDTSIKGWSLDVWRAGSYTTWWWKWTGASGLG